MTRILAIATIVVLLAFGVAAAYAASNLFNPAAIIIVAVVFGGLSWIIWQTAQNEDDYRKKLFWEGVDIANEKLLEQRPGNLSDALELIDVLKGRVLDLDEARNEAVEKYNVLLAEQNEGDE